MSIIFSSRSSRSILLTLVRVEIPQNPAMSSLVTGKSIKMPSAFYLPKHSMKLYKHAHTAPFLPFTVIFCKASKIMTNRLR